MLFNIAFIHPKQSSTYRNRIPHRGRSRMEGPRQSKLLGRLLGRLRGDRSATLDSRFSSSGLSSTGCGSSTFEVEDMLNEATGTADPSGPQIDDTQFAANVDLRYGGQYLTPEQLPEFCNQLHHLVEIIRNIQSYANITGEYPSELERRLEAEAREVSALAAEARNARDVVARTRTQRRAVRAQRRSLLAHLNQLKETEERELESTVRLSDRKLFKSWEALKDSVDVCAFDPLLEEVRNKQTALECLIRLVDNRKTSIGRVAASPQPLPAPAADEARRRHEGRRAATKRRRKDAAREPRSVPLSGEPSRHDTPPQAPECTSRYRGGSAGTVVLTPLELPSRGSVRDILFFTTTNLPTI